MLLTAAGEKCQIRWSDIRNSTMDDKGQTGIAHVGRLLETEITEIEAYAKAERTRIDEAMRSLA